MTNSTSDRDLGPKFGFHASKNCFLEGDEDINIYIYSDGNSDHLVTSKSLYTFNVSANKKQVIIYGWKKHQNVHAYKVFICNMS